MVTEVDREALLSRLDQTVQACLTYFEGPGKTSSVRIETWGPWEVLAHLYYRHFATAWGVMSAANGGPPWPIPAAGSTEGNIILNDIAVKVHEGQSFEQICDGLRLAHAALLRGARQATDWDAPAWLYHDGRAVSVQRRLEISERHWRVHLEELTAAS